MKTAASGFLLADTHSLEDIVVALGRYGLRRIELWPQNIPVLDPAMPHLANRYEGRDVDAARETLANAGVEAVCLALDGAFNPLAGDPAEYVRSFLHALDVCTELGIGLLNHYCYNFALASDADYRPFLRMLAPVIEKAEALGVTLVLENEAHDATSSPQRMREIIEAADSPAFMTNFDVVNYYQASWEGFPSAYDLLKPYIRYVHLKGGCLAGPASTIADSVGGALTGSRAPGAIYYPPLPDGAVNIAGLADRLHADGYDGYCTIEPHTSVAWADHYFRIETDYLRRLGVFEF